MCGVRRLGSEIVESIVFQRSIKAMRLSYPGFVPPWIVVFPATTLPPGSSRSGRDPLPEQFLVEFETKQASSENLRLSFVLQECSGDVMFRGLAEVVPGAAPDPAAR